MTLRFMACAAAAAAAVGFTGAATAADLGSLKDPPPVLVADPPISWTGCYVGTDGGYKWGRNHVTTPTTYNLDNRNVFNVPGGVGNLAPLIAANQLVGNRGVTVTGTDGTTTTTHSDGGLWGGQAGCNYDTRSGVVVGIEISGTWDFAKQSYTEEIVTADGRNLHLTNVTTEIERQCQFRVGPRVGTTVPGLGNITNGAAPLVYITGGYAATCYKVKQTTDSTPFRNAVSNPDVSDSRFESGWYAGFGIDIPTAFLITNSFVQIEYTHADYGSTSYGMAGSAATRTFDNSSNEVRVGFKYRFQ